MSEHIPPHGPGCPVEPRLSEDDEKVARLIALGWTRVEIGKAMHMSPETIKDHTDRIRDHHEKHAGLELSKHRLLQGWLAGALR